MTTPREEVIAEMRELQGLGWEFYCKEWADKLEKPCVWRAIKDEPLCDCTGNSWQSMWGDEPRYCPWCGQPVEVKE